MSARSSLIGSSVPSTTVSPTGSVSVFRWRSAAAGPEVAVVAGGAVVAPGDRPREVAVVPGAFPFAAVVPGDPRVLAVVPGAAVDGVVAAVVGGGAVLLGVTPGAVVAETAGAPVARVVAEPLAPRRLLKLPPARTSPF